MSKDFLSTQKRITPANKNLAVAVTFIVGFVGVAFFAYMKSIDILDIASSIFASILAAGIFLAIQIYIIQRDADIEFIESVNSNVDATIVNTLNKSREINDEFCPINIFENDSTSPNNEFNTDVSQNLTKSNVYLFRGFSGRYTVSRLSDKRLGRFSEVSLFLTKPNSDVAIRRAASDLIDSSPNANADGRKLLLNQVLQTIIGSSFVFMKSDSFTLYFLDDPIEDRYEIIDDFIYISYYDDISRNRKKFPNVYKFSKNSVFYKSQNRILSYYKTSINSKLNIDDNLDDEKIINFFKNNFQIEISENDIALAKSDFAEFVDSFKSY